MQVVCDWCEVCVGPRHAAGCFGEPQAPRLGGTRDDVSDNKKNEGPSAFDEEGPRRESVGRWVYLGR